jgi:hypothetical protein
MIDHRIFGATVAAAFAVSLVATAAAAGEARQDLLQDYAAKAQSDDPAFAGFSAERGERLFTRQHGSGKPDTPACTSCHGSDPKAPGRTRAGKPIDPMAVSANPARYTDGGKVEKWFRRNCNSVLGRECTAREKGDFITFMAGR